MDRNTVIGLVLIGLILSVFTIFNQPSEEEIKQRNQEIAQAKEKEAKEATQEKKAASSDKSDESKKLAASLQPKLDKNGQQIKTDKGLVYIDTLSGKETVISLNANEPAVALSDLKGELIRLENNKLRIDFNTKGGQVAAVIDPTLILRKTEKRRIVPKKAFCVCLERATQSINW
jgi:YidC/Oxa1 family membrane protein insertase